jgi:methylated-DNA-[protein]-cysteine S-methyltransferase
MTIYDIITSPLGDITIATDGTKLTALHIEGDRYFAEIPAGWSKDPAHPVLDETKRQLHEYFSTNRTHFNLEAAPAGTPFQQAVWEAIAQIPAGSTATYSEIAQQIGRPNAVRAVGTAVGRNPICIIVPCHRVKASNGGFGGYVAGIACKEYLLGLESASAILLP